MPLRTGAGLDAGEVDAAAGNNGLVYPANAGGRSVTDKLDDAVTLTGFPRYAKYVLTGAPWEPPLVTGIVTSGGAGSGSAGANDVPTVPLDGGGKVTLSGVGFARSPFLACAVKPPSPLGRAGVAAAAETAAETNAAEYASPDPNLRGVSTRTPFVRVGASASTASSAAPQDSASVPPLSSADLHHPEAAAARAQAWSRANAASRLGEIPPLQPLPVLGGGGGGGADITHAGVVYGWHEVVECTTPAAPFPSDRHELSVSNDGEAVRCRLNLLYVLG